MSYLWFVPRPGGPRWLGSEVCVGEFVSALFPCVCDICVCGREGGEWGGREVRGEERREERVEEGREEGMEGGNGGREGGREGGRKNEEEGKIDLVCLYGIPSPNIQFTTSN